MKMAIDLGFIDADCVLLDSRFFPSKVGGKPAWLDLKNIPHVDELTCQKCDSPMQFLCQLYCPIDETSCTFHRTLFVFFCSCKTCFRLNNSDNFVVLRSQLPKRNEYYPDTPPVDDLTWRPDISPAKFNISLCRTCGLRANLTSDKNDFAYCSHRHRERSLLATQTEHAETNSNRGALLPEYGIEIRPENDDSDTDTNSENSDHNSSEQRRTASPHSDSKNDGDCCTNSDGFDMEELFEKCTATVNDKTFLKFSSRVADQPKQIIRYGRDMDPLWISDQHVPSSTDSIPPCQYCGCNRVFEFQILPQLLNYLNLDDDDVDCVAGILDWGTLAVYTCRNSCDQGPAYKKEFIWKQDVTN